MICDSKMNPMKIDCNIKQKIDYIVYPMKIDYNVNLIISGLIRYDQIIRAKSEIL